MFKNSMFTNNLAAARVLEEAFPDWTKKIKDSSGKMTSSQMNDDIFADIAKVFNYGHDVYPPSNMIRTKTGYIIEMALAGYNKTDINVTRLNNTLTVSCEKQRDNDQSDYIHRGLAFKSFTKKYTLPTDSVVNSVTMADGLLTILIEQEKPESKTVKYQVN